MAAAVFASLAIASTGVVRASGHQIVDTGRYERYSEFVQDGLLPYRDFDVEYPPGALLLFIAPSLVSDGTDAYFWTFAALMALLGAAAVLLTGVSLSRLGRSQRARAAVLGLLALSPVLFGGVLLTRFDVAVAALVAGATLAVLCARPRVAAVLLGLGAAVKLYPLLVVPLLAALVLRRRGPREAAVSVALSLGVLAAAYLPFAALAPSGVADSVWRQLSRPLQIESLGAGALVVLHSLVGLEVEGETSFGSQNLVGATAAAVAVTLSLAGAAAILATLVLHGRGDGNDESFVRHTAAVLVAFVAFGKVLSPQFLVWLLFPLALVAGRRGAAAGACFAVAALATAIWFPWRYFDLPRQLDPLVASLVVLRGAALVAAFVVLVYRPARSRSRSLGSAKPNLR